jgi:hypothetical protein
MIAWIIWNVATFPAVLVSDFDAVNRWGGGFPFEFFRSGIAMVDGILPVNGIDFGPVTRDPFCSYGSV